MPACLQLQAPLLQEILVTPHAIDIICFKSVSDDALWGLVGAVVKLVPEPPSFFLLQSWD